MGEEGEEGGAAEAEAGEASGEEHEAEGLDPTVREIKWPSLPEGIKVASKPSALDASLASGPAYIHSLGGALRLVHGHHH